MASTSDGPSVFRKPYITSRQVQKLSSAEPMRSASPAMARWKAWECVLLMPGSTGPPLSSASPRLPLRTAFMCPVSSISIKTSRCHPAGRSASAAKSVVICRYDTHSCASRWKRLSQISVENQATLAKSPIRQIAKSSAGESAIQTGGAPCGTLYGLMPGS